MFVSVVSRAWAVLTWVWTSVTASYPIPGWIVIIGGMIVLVALMRFIGGLLAAAPHSGYTEDVIDGARWRWSWTSTGISTPVGFCPDCDLQLVCTGSIGPSQQAFVCERCPADPGLPGLPGMPSRVRFRVVATIAGSSCYGACQAIEREILRRFRTREFPQ